MGRLFWKIFFAFWLAQLAAGIGAGTAVWLRDHPVGGQESLRRADPFLDAAQAVLVHGGVDALRDLLLERQEGSAPPIYAVDESDREIIGREPPPAALAQARLSAEAAGLEARLVAADDGHAYLLFTAGGDGAGSQPSAAPLSPAILAGAGVSASLLLSAWLAWYLAGPIRNLRPAFDTLADGKLDVRAGSAMGQNSEHMAEGVGSPVDAQRRLLHDVSHELRSPLARLQVAVGLARREPDKMDASLGRIEREAERLDALVGELLALSRLEAGVPGAPEEMIDMAGLLADIVEDARFEAEAKGVRVECDFPAALVIRGRKELIRRAIENVVRNAVQHAPADSLVSIDGKLDDNRRALRLRVSDQGEGVPESQLAAIFRPFFRDAGGEGGVGLGLSIARRAIEAHGGKIGARNRAKGGLCVEWILPVAKDKKDN